MIPDLIWDGIPIIDTFFVVKVNGFRDTLIQGFSKLLDEYARVEMSIMDKNLRLHEMISSVMPNL